MTLLLNGSRLSTTEQNRITVCGLVEPLRCGHGLCDRSCSENQCDRESDKKRRDARPQEASFDAGKGAVERGA